MSKFITKEVRLQSVTQEEGRAAVDRMEEIFDQFGVPDATIYALWNLYGVSASDALIRYGRLDPPMGHEETNGHS